MGWYCWDVANASGAAIAAGEHRAADRGKGKLRRLDSVCSFLFSKSYQKGSLEDSIAMVTTVAPGQCQGL